MVTMITGPKDVSSVVFFYTSKSYFILLTFILWGNSPPYSRLFTPSRAMKPHDELVPLNVAWFPALHMFKDFGLGVGEACGM